MSLAIRVPLILILFLAGIWFVISQPLYKSSEKVSSPEVSAQRLETYVRHLSEQLPSRLGAEANLNPIVEWIEKQLEPFANKPHEKKLPSKL